MYQALYRKYRPTSFEDVVGQDVIVRILKNTVVHNKISHAYLFTGPRGTGKTSVAKIFAKIVNCENLNGFDPCNKCVSCTQTNNKQNTDIIEIDAASNNGVDEIRELRDKVNLVPSYGKYKVYIIDEVHMLTTAAFNALLKTLEEPPKHIIFILATTEPHKIPMTILSRCQRFDFKKISIKAIKNRIEHICKLEKIDIDDGAIDLISSLSDGGLRDALSLLDQLTSYSNDKISVNDVHEVYGTITNEEIFILLNRIYKGDIKSSFDLVDSYDNDGKNLVKIIENSIELIKNTIVFNNNSEYFNEEKENYKELCDLVSEEKLYSSIDILLESLKSSKNTTNVKLLFQLSIIKIIELCNERKEKFNEIPILEEKKKIVVERKVQVDESNEPIQEKLIELKNLRINNTLAKYDKKELNSFRADLEKIKDLLMNPDYSSMVSLILDGELKAKGDNNLIFVYEVKNYEKLFNQSLKNIEQIFQRVYGIHYKPIAVSIDEWDPIKKEFNESIKTKKNKYVYEEEKFDIEEIYETKNKQTKTKKNEIEDIFDDIILYK